MAAEVSATLYSDSIRSVIQQQQVCLKNVHHPVSYDEVHIPSEEQAGGSGDDGCNNSNNGNAASDPAGSAEGVVSVP